ncbi:MAG: class II lanthipeptide, LchA2/BrtA2 family [Lachnospiraceae bacterium]|nr:class II lanthipeptide, LchA2/BrtA2 family [Lachnospiraceae bacterium]
MSKEAMGYISEKDLEELVAEENLAGGTTWGCAVATATIGATVAFTTAFISNSGSTNACTKSCRF